MRLGGRVQAAIDVLADIEKSNRPASEVLKDWGSSHRFAGSGDRSAIGNLVYDALRKKRSHSWLMDSDQASSILFGTLLSDWNYSQDELVAQFDGDKFAPQMPDQSTFDGFLAREIEDAQEPIQANVQDWCSSSFVANFDDEWVREAQVLSARPPLDMRINTVKATAKKVLKQFRRNDVKETSIARNGLRIEPGFRDAKLPNIKADAVYQKGWIEIQDQGSQIAAEMVFARPGENVLDFCAGAGGKTLALSAIMENTGQIHAYDSDKSRLAPIYERVKRAGLHNVQIHQPGDDLGALAGKMDRVVIDAPCTGSGVWRRRPDAKWKLTQKNLEERLLQQEEVLSEAAPFVRVGGYLAYITCSVFPEENENQVYSFIDDNPQFELLSVGEVWEDLYGQNNLKPWSSDMKSITLTPASTNTDGFFFAVMERTS